MSAPDFSNEYLNIHHLFDFLNVMSFHALERGDIAMSRMSTKLPYNNHNVICINTTV